MNLESLRPYCDHPRQEEFLNAYLEHQSYRAAARALGIDDKSIRRSIKRLKERAAKHGYSPEHDMKHPVPEGFNVKGVSTYYGPDGEVHGQWVKSQQDAAQREILFRESIAAACEEIPPEKPTEAPNKGLTDLANLYIITDYHLGMLSWPEETGEDWDTQLAEDLLVRWFKRAIESSPPADTGVFAQLGDFLHWDGLEAVTPTNHHVLDADTRFQLVVRVAIRAIRRVVRMLLAKHSHVYLLMAEGNHDPASSIWLREFFAALYEDEPRITVDQSADVYYCYEHGLTSLFFHHGHKRKVSDIDDIFAAKFREVFGRTRFSYAHMGHLHHVDVKETNLMLVEQHPTLAAADAYATRLGYVPQRNAKVITYSKKYGEVGRVIVSPEMC